METCLASFRLALAGGKTGGGGGFPQRMGGSRVAKSVISLPNMTSVDGLELCWNWAVLRLKVGFFRYFAEKCCFSY